jgi:hypothetical protein
MNTSHIIGYLLEFALQTVFLTAALWIMIKLQKLNYGFFGLIVAAAIANVVEMVLEAVFSRALGGYIGITLSSLVTIIVLSICVRKVTQADTTDVGFTVGVGYALTFCMNLFLLSSLLGDLRPPRPGAEVDIVPIAARPIGEDTPADHTNTTAQLSQNPTTTTIVQPTKPASTGPEPLNKSFVVRGVTRAARPSVVLEAGGKQYTLFKGDMVTMKIPRGFVAVQFKGLDQNQVLLNVEGEEVKIAQ